MAWLAVFSVVLALLSFGLIWLSELSRYYVRNRTVEATVLEQGRQHPSDAVLEEICSDSLLPGKWQSADQIIATAEKLQQGRAEMPGYEAIEIHLPFDPSDLERGTSTWQLEFSGLVVPKTFMDAYQLTGREEFYASARDVLLAWANYDRESWLNHGFLWNDHAVAARVRTLADFWRIYRHRPDYKPDIARAIWEFAARTGELLAKPDQFTVATNHGIMQNLALWQLCLAFPSLPKIEEYKQLALRRLEAQMSFYIGPDGVVLEHSAGYHAFGLYLIEMTLRYAQHLNLNVPSDWNQKYEKAKDFYAEIRLPDGSLPMFGDTSHSETDAGTAVIPGDPSRRAGPFLTSQKWRPLRPVEFFPVAGYAIVWDGLENWPFPRELAQTVVTWSYYPGHGHKHADELSVLLWAANQVWWTNVGYWPYDDLKRELAECWAGSNAPHLLGETCGSSRSTSLVSYAHAGSLFSVEMERRGPKKFVSRRQVLHLTPALWILIDSAVGAPEKILQTIWTTLPNVNLVQGTSPGEFSLIAKGKQDYLKSFFLGPPRMKIRSLRGSTDPFAGWVTIDDRPQPAGAIMTEQPVDGSWAVTVWKMQREAENRGPIDLNPSVLQWTNEHDWDILIPLKPCGREVSRRGDLMAVRGVNCSGVPAVSAHLSSPPASAMREIGMLHAAYQVAAGQYPLFRNLAPSRQRISFKLLGLLIFQELFLLLVCQKWGRKYVLTLRSLSVFCWLAIAVWVQVFYLRVF